MDTTFISKKCIDGIADAMGRKTVVARPQGAGADGAGCVAQFGHAED